jgi:UDP-N-acetylglucosamine 2-epimerase (non-hydrolysing)
LLDYIRLTGYNSAVKKVLAVVGTRPDAIKMAPVLKGLLRCPDIETTLIASGQHREMLDQVLTAFDLHADANFDVMTEAQSLAYLTSAILSSLDSTLEKARPDLVVAQGDTTTTMVASLAAFYRQIPFAHVEAGLRTDSVRSPFPEEFNRRAAGLIADLHFAPTRRAWNALLGEGHDPASVLLTGNTSIDAVLDVAERAPTYQPPAAGRMLLVTTHRRENWGVPQDNICSALVQILDQVRDAFVVLPMHRNPAVRRALQAGLGGHPRAFLVEPPEYAEFVSMMKAAHLILTDSGGVQEEAPSLGKPVLVLRRETERPEGVEAGNARLVGTEVEPIVSAALSLLTDPGQYQRMARVANPYGDGNASARIVAAIRTFLGLEAESIAAFQG